MLRLLAAFLLLALLPAAAAAQTARAMRAQVEASMLVTGFVEIDQAGSIVAHGLDERERLPDYVVSLVERALPELRFEPVLVNGEATTAKAKMSLRLVATPAGDGEMKVGIRSAHFGDDDAGVPSSRLRAIAFGPPTFPAAVLRKGGKGIVYLLVKVAPDGTVEDAVAEQVNLTVVGDARTLEAIRNQLAKASLVAARKWTFAPPTTGEDAGRDAWVVRIPVEYAYTGEATAGYGEWRSYLPGPRQRPSWARPDPPGFSPDAVVARGLHAEQSRFRLVTPLEG